MEAIKSLLQKANEMGLERLDAQMLMLHVCEQKVHARSWLYVHEDDQVAKPIESAFWELVKARLNHTPMAYLLGHVEFYGLNLSVTPDVLVPRPDTEILVDWALELIQAFNLKTLVDLGCGSGAMALAIKHHAPSIAMTAVDFSSQALEVARRNAARLNLKIEFQESDWMGALQGEKFDLVVSNPPYIAQDDEHLINLQAEPMSALVSLDDGLSDIKQIAQQARAHLNPSGFMLIEHGWTQGLAVREVLLKAGFEHVTTRKDLGGNERVTGGQWQMNETVI